MATKKEIMKYVNLPWSYTIEPEEDYFVVYVNELPKVCTDGKTIEDAIINVKDAIYSAIDAMLSAGNDIPLPIDKSKFKGKIAYRTSEKRHYNIARIAKRKHLSISKILDVLVDEGIKTLEQ